MSATSTENSPVQQAIVRTFAYSRAMIEEFLRDAQDAGEVPEGADIERLARLFLSLIQGVMIVAKSSGSAEVFDDVVDIFLPMIEQRNKVLETSETAA